jgi:hypothetical protein
MTLASRPQSPTGTSKPHKSLGGLPAAQFNRLYPKRSGAEVSGSASGRPERFGYNPLHYLAFTPDKACGREGPLRLKRLVTGHEMLHVGL